MGETWEVELFVFHKVVPFICAFLYGHPSSFASEVSFLTKIEPVSIVPKQEESRKEILVDLFNSIISVASMFVSHMGSISLEGLGGNGFGDLLNSLRSFATASIS